MVVGKVLAYITRGEELLVFTEPDFPETGFQVPGGTLLDGEDPRDGVLREAREETGFPGVLLVRSLGSIRAIRHGVQHEDHGFHLTFAEPVPERWEHGEFSYERPIRFAFSWMSLRDPRLELWPHQAAFLPELKRAIGLEVE